MNYPLISVIIPIYNGVQYLSELEMNLNAQTYKTLEIIMVDDGSTDSTLSLCQEYAKRDSRLQVFHKNNGGASSARNYGLLKATGEYIAFLDVDDFFYPEYFEYLYDLIKKYNADMACCGYYKMLDTETRPDFPKAGKEYVFDRQEALRNYLYRRYFSGYSVLKLYRRDVLKDLRFEEDIVYAEDALFALEAIKACNKVAYGERVLYVYYQHKTSITHIENPKLYMRTWERTYANTVKYAQQENPDILNAAYAKCFILAIDYCCRMWKTTRSDIKEFVCELLDYIRTTDANVLKDGDCRLLNRLLALFSCIHTPSMIRMCRIYLWLKAKLNFETRRSV